MYARYLCSRDALGLKAEQPVGQARRATIGYLEYKAVSCSQTSNTPVTRALCAELSIFRGEYSHRFACYATVGSEFNETENKPLFRFFKILTQKKISARLFQFQGGRILPRFPGYATGWSCQSTNLEGVGCPSPPHTTPQQKVNNYKLTKLLNITSKLEITMHLLAHAHMFYKLQLHTELMGNL